MKTGVGLRILISALLMVLASGCKHKEQEPSSSGSGFKANFSLEPRTSPAAAKAAAPVLVQTTATIGPKGGTLASSDGKLAVSVPAGAFATDTVVRIQPTENAPEESFGPVYELSPEGVTFPQPVTLTWHLSEVDLAKTSLDNLTVQSSGADGVWQPQPGMQRDEATHTISVTASHFSKWDLAMTLRLKPAEAKVYVEDPLLIDAIIGVATERSPLPPDSEREALNSTADPDDDLLAPPSRPDSDLRNTLRHVVWRVNGVPFGNSSVGRISNPKSLNSPEVGGGRPGGTAEVVDFYTAPASVPTPNPVTVSFELTVGKKKMVATSLVTVLPFEDHWAGSSNITQGDGTKVSSDFVFAPVNVPGESAGGATKQQYEVLSGTVHYSGPETVSGCPLKISPSFHTLEAKEGMLVVDKSDPKRWVLSGQGQSVWLARYTTYCPKGYGAMDMGVSAGWWPVNPFNMGTPTTVNVTPGQVSDAYVNVDGPMGRGTVHLRHVDKAPDRNLAP